MLEEKFKCVLKMKVFNTSTNQSRHNTSICKMYVYEQFIDIFFIEIKYIKKKEMENFVKFQFKFNIILANIKSKLRIDIEHLL